jgi:hypothetical protein
MQWRSENGVSLGGLRNLIARLSVVSSQGLYNVPSCQWLLVAISKIKYSDRRQCL